MLLLKKSGVMKKFVLEHCIYVHKYHDYNVMKVCWLKNLCIYSKCKHLQMISAWNTTKNKWIYFTSIWLTLSCSLWSYFELKFVQIVVCPFLVYLVFCYAFGVYLNLLDQFLHSEKNINLIIVLNWMRFSLKYCFIELSFLNKRILSKAYLNIFTCSLVWKLLLTFQNQFKLKRL